MSDELLVEYGSVLRLTINRPRRRNALTSGLLLDLAGAIEAASADPRVRVIAIQGAGSAFSAGADLDALGGLTADSARSVMAAANRLIRAVVTASQIVVALVRGSAAAYGAALAFAADLVIAGEEATFLIPFGKVGLMPDGGATALVAAFQERRPPRFNDSQTSQEKESESR